MEIRAVTGALLCLMLLRSPHSVSPEPAECVNWREVFPTCECGSAFDEDGKELGSVASVDCSSKGLTSVPQKQRNYAKTLHEFRLSKNQITTLPDDAFQGVKIRHLDMTGNSLGIIADNAFRGTENELTILNIEGNSQVLPQRTALRKLIELRELTMKNYKVTHLSESTDDLYFQSFRKLEKLTLDSWGLESISSHAFLAADNLHTMRSLALLNQKLPSLPIDVLRAPELQNLESLRISNTNIRDVTAYAFNSLNNIREIILSDNEIASIEDDSFNNVGDTLEKIDLSGNFLGAGQHDNLPQLKDLSALTQLSLSKNEFSAMPRMENLRTAHAFSLDFSENDLRTLSASDLSSYIGKLQELDLSQNDIAQIDDDTFSDASELSSLILTYQGGTSLTGLNVPTSLIHASDSLTYLDMSGQKVDETDLWKILGQLTNLQTLLLHSTELTSIPDFAFENLTELKKLDLSYNFGIVQLTDKTFVGPRTIQTLALRSTGITAIPDCLLHNHTGSLSLDLGFTQIICDCTVKALLERYHGGTVTFPDPQSIPTCSDGLPFIQKDQGDLVTCDPEECEDYYTAPPPTQPQPSESTDSPETLPTIEITVQDVDTNSIRISWGLSDSIDFRMYTITISSSNSQQPIKDIDINFVGVTEQNIQDLTAGTLYRVCVYAHFNSKLPVSACQFQSTKPNGEATDDSSSANTGIIVGCVVGVVVLLLILAALVYLLVIRRRPQKAEAPPSMAGRMQPRTFTKNELPTMNGDSRSFVKAKKNGIPDSKPIGGMQVVAISDGQTRPSGGRVGRAHLLLPDGTYEPMDKSKSKDLDYEPMKKPFDTSQGMVNAAYENDRGSLPPTPRKKQFEARHGEVNAAYENDHGSLPPTPRKKQFEPGQGEVNATYENDHGSLPPTPRVRQFEPMQGAVNAGFEKDHDSLPSSPHKQSFDQHSFRPHHAYKNEAFSHNKYDEITV